MTTLSKHHPMVTLWDPNKCHCFCQLLLSHSLSIKCLFSLFSRVGSFFPIDRLNRGNNTGGAHLIKPNRFTAVCVCVWNLSFNNLIATTLPAHQYCRSIAPGKTRFSGRHSFCFSRIIKIKFIIASFSIRQTVHTHAHLFNN